jgi:hypothetical protein
MLPIIIKKDETKNFLNFEEVTTGLKICLIKSDFNKAIERFKRWKDHDSTNFYHGLFNLMCHADDNNKLKFLVGFPAETTVYLLWQQTKDTKEFLNIWGNIEVKDTTETIINNPTSNLLEGAKMEYLKQKYVEDKQKAGL